ncbi:MAG: CbiX/SirB N-terminal domain-containing protein [Rubrivivax sp.]|nr:CbiX/SirB N-terminal domain-containing protein [Rubrivivax sp.]
MSPGLILFAHGARDPRWAAPFEAVAARIRADRPGLPVRLSYLELMSPDLPTAAAELVAEGCDEVTVLPLFLGAGGHVRRDLPVLVDGLRAAHPAVRWSLQPPVGELPALTAAMAQAALDAMAE